MEREPVFLGDRLKELREQRGMTQTSLADLAGVSQPTISDLELGKNPRVDAWIVAKLASALHTTMRYLLGLTDNPVPPEDMPRLAVNEAVRRVLLLRPDARDALVEFLRIVQSADGSDSQTEDTH